MAKIGSLWRALYWGDGATVTRTQQADGSYADGVTVEDSSTGAQVLSSSAAGTERGLAVRVVSAPSASGGTSSSDGASYSAGSSSGTPLMAARDDSGTTTLAEDKVGIVRATTNRALHVNIRDASGNEVSVGGGTQYAEDVASAGGESMTLAGAVRQDTISSNTSTDGDYTYLKTTSAGRLYASATVDAALPAGTNAIGKLAANDGVDVGDVTINNSTGAAAVNIQDGGNSITVDGTVAVSNSFALDATLTGGTQKSKLVDTGGTNVASISAAGRLSVDASGVAVPITDNSGSLTVDAPVGTPAFVRLSDGASAITALPVTDNSGSLTVDAPVGTPVFITATPSTTGGWTPASQTALTNTKTAVKAGAGTFGGYMIYNPNASAVFIQVWDVAIGSITVGTTAPTYVITIPATSAANLELTNGVKHSNEINVAATTTATGSTAPGSAVTCAFFYK